jgi:multidrug efflux pump subunit AcrA (membrane-fusion protein)
MSALEERIIEDEVTAPGQWRAVGEIPIRAPVAASVESLTARPGDQVSEGETLGRLVTRESLAALYGARLLAGQASDSESRAEAARAITLAERDLVRVPLVSPRAGMVIRRSVEGGAQVDDAAEILALVPRDGIICEARVPATETARVRTGEAAVITEQNGSTRTAIVKRILPTAGSTDQASLVWLTPTSGAFPDLDRYTTVAIKTGAPRRAVVVPDSALVQDDLTGKSSVALVSAENRVIWTVVELGARSDGGHELLSPRIAPGSRVIVAGQAGLPDSTLVEASP